MRTKQVQASPPREARLFVRVWFFAVHEVLVDGPCPVSKRIGSPDVKELIVTPSPLKFSTALPYFLLDNATALPYKGRMQTVVETKAYISDAKSAGMSDDEMQAVVDTFAANPEAGAIMPGCGGARKLRVAKPGAGKSGGYRVISFYCGADLPVFLITVFGKNEKANLSASEKAAVAKLCKMLKDSYY